MFSHPLEMSTNGLGMARRKELSWSTGDGVRETWDTVELARCKESQREQKGERESLEDELVELIWIKFSSRRPHVESDLPSVCYRVILPMKPAGEKVKGKSELRFERDGERGRARWKRTHDALMGRKENKDQRDAPLNRYKADRYLLGCSGTPSPGQKNLFREEKCRR